METQTEKRYIYLIENDIKNIFFNSNNKNKDLSLKNLIPLMQELKGYMPYITQEYLINLLNSDDRQQEYTKQQLIQRVCKVLKRIGLNKEALTIYHKTTEVLKYSIDIPIYEKEPIFKEHKSLLTRSFKEFIGYSKDFKYKGHKKVLIGVEIKPLISEQIRKIIF